MDVIMEILSFVFLGALWLLAVGGYQDLPDRIPVHFNTTGEADGYGDRSSILALCVVATVIYTGMTFLNFYPHIFNYPSPITADNAQRSYQSTTRMLRVLKLSVVVVFAAIIYLTYRAVFSGSYALPVWFLPAALAVLLVPVAFYLFKLLRRQA
jgi:uncharacterized membrane protein